MKFATNYSPQAVELVERGEIDVDLFKCPEFPDLIADVSARYGCYVHFPFRMGRGRLDDVDWNEANVMIASTEARYVNAHLAPSILDFPSMALETEDGAQRGQCVEAMKRDARDLAAQYGKDGILLENVMWDPDPPWEIPAVALEADVIREIVAETDCGFLLDLAHARITALHFGVDERAYLEALPVERMKELHVSGTMLDGNGLWQDHYPMEDHDWDLLAWALTRIRGGDWPRPWVVALEYGGVGPAYEARTDAAVLAEQAPRIRDSVHAVQ